MADLSPEALRIYELLKGTTSSTFVSEESTPRWDQEHVYPPLAELRRAQMTDMQWAALSEWEKDLWEMKHLPEKERINIIEGVVMWLPAAQRDQRRKELMEEILRFGEPAPTLDSSTTPASTTSDISTVLQAPTELDGVPVAVITTMGSASARAVTSTHVPTAMALDSTPASVPTHEMDPCSMMPTTCSTICLGGNTSATATPASPTTVSTMLPSPAEIEDVHDAVDLGVGDLAASAPTTCSTVCLAGQTSMPSTLLSSAAVPASSACTPASPISVSAASMGPVVGDLLEGVDDLSSTSPSVCLSLWPSGGIGTVASKACSGNDCDKPSSTMPSSCWIQCSSGGMSNFTHNLLVESDTGCSYTAPVPVPQVLAGITVTTSAGPNDATQQDDQGLLNKVVMLEKFKPVLSLEQHLLVLVVMRNAVVFWPVFQSARCSPVILLPWDPGASTYGMCTKFQIMLEQKWMVSLVEQLEIATFPAMPYNIHHNFPSGNLMQFGVLSLHNRIKRSQWLPPQSICIQRIVLLSVPWLSFRCNWAAAYPIILWKLPTGHPHEDPDGYARSFVLHWTSSSDENKMHQLTAVQTFWSKIFSSGETEDFLQYDHLQQWGPPDQTTEYLECKEELGYACTSVEHSVDKVMEFVDSLTITCELHHSPLVVENVVVAPYSSWCMRCVKLDIEDTQECLSFLQPKPPWSHLASISSTSELMSDMCTVLESLHIIGTSFELDLLGFPAWCLFYARFRPEAYFPLPSADHGMLKSAHPNFGGSSSLIMQCTVNIMEALPSAISPWPPDFSNRRTCTQNIPQLDCQGMSLLPKASLLPLRVESIERITSRTGIQLSCFSPQDAELFVFYFAAWRISNLQGTMEIMQVSGEWYFLITVETEWDATFTEIIFALEVQSVQLQPVLFKWSDILCHATHTLIARSNVDVMLEELLVRRATCTLWTRWCLHFLPCSLVITTLAISEWDMLNPSVETWVLVNCHFAKAHFQWTLAVQQFTSSSGFLAILIGETQVHRHYSCTRVLPDANCKRWISGRLLRGNTHHSEVQLPGPPSPGMCLNILMGNISSSPNGVVVISLATASVLRCLNKGKSIDEPKPPWSLLVTTMSNLVTVVESMHHTTSRELFSCYADVIRCLLGALHFSLQSYFVISDLEIEIRSMNVNFIPLLHLPWDPGGLNQQQLCYRFTAEMFSSNAHCEVIVQANVIAVSVAAWYVLCARPRPTHNFSVHHKARSKGHGDIFGNCKEAEAKSATNVNPIFLYINSVHIGRNYYFDYACCFDNVRADDDYYIGVFLEQVGAICYLNLNLVKVCLDLSKVMTHQVPWDPGGPTWHRLEVKPQFKEGGMLATSPTGLAWAATTGLGPLEIGGSNYLYGRKGTNKGLGTDGFGLLCFSLLPPLMFLFFFLLNARTW